MTNFDRTTVVLAALACCSAAAFAACGDSGGSGSGASGPGGAGGAGAATSSSTKGATGGGTSQGGGGSGQGGSTSQGGGGSAEGGGTQGTGGAGGGPCAGVVCTALDGCHAAGTCDPQTGQCSNPNASDGTTCDDGSSCTIGDTCQAGVCTPPTGNGAVDASCLPTSGITHILPGQRPGEQFTVGAAGQLTGIEIALEKCTNQIASGNIRLDVIDGAGTVLGTGRIAASAITHACSAYPLDAGTVGEGLFDLTAACIAVTAGQTLRFELSQDGIPVGTCSNITHFCTGGSVGTACTSDAQCDQDYGASFSSSDIYAGGTMMLNGAAQATSDLDFKVFVR